MKKIAAFCALVALAVSELVLASGIATSVTGAVQTQIGTAAPRPLRTGDRLNQGDTVSTGPQSSVVIKFDDGQVAALTANSRMTITTYSYQPESKKGNVLLSLVNGGMRFVTGLIGKNSPENISIRAATATIGIRGTDFTVITNAGTVFAKVDAGKITFTINGKTVEVDTGRAVLAQPNGTVSQGTINEIQRLLSDSAIGRDILNALGGLQGLTGAINDAFPGEPRQGDGGPGSTEPGSGIGSGQGTPSGPGSTGGGGGGGGSPPGSPS